MSIPRSIMFTAFLVGSICLTLGGLLYVGIAWSAVATLLLVTAPDSADEA